MLFLASVFSGLVDGSEGARTSFWAEVVSCLVVEEGSGVEGLGFSVVVVGLSWTFLEEEEGPDLSVKVVDAIEDSISAEVGRVVVSFVVVVVGSGWDTSSTCSGGSGGVLAVGREE